MSKWARWKKFLFFVIFIFVAVRIAYIGVRKMRPTKEYSTSISYDLSEAKKLHMRISLLLLQAIKIDCIVWNSSLITLMRIKKGTITPVLTKGEELIYQTNLSLKNVNNEEWKRVYVNAKMERGAEYRISLNANDDCTQTQNAFVVQNSASEICDSFTASGKEIGDGTIAVNLGYLVGTNYL